MFVVWAVAALGLLGGAYAPFTCSDYFYNVDKIMNTYEGAQLLNAFNGKELTMWGTYAGFSEEKEWKCRKFSIDYPSKNWTMKYVDGTSSVTHSGTFELMQGESNYLKATQLVGPENYMMGVWKNGEPQNWYITYISKTELILRSCVQFFLAVEADYVYSTTNLTKVNKDCFAQTVWDVIGYSTEKVDPQC